MKIFPNIIPNQATWRLDSNSSIFPSPFAASHQSVQRLGSKFAADLTYRNLTQAQKDTLGAFIGSLDGHSDSFVMPVFGNKSVSPLTQGEQLTDWHFDDATNPDGWTVTNGTITISGGLLWILNTSGGSDVTARLQLTIPDGRKWLVRFGMVMNADAGAAEYSIGTTTGGTDIVARTDMAEGDNHVVIQPGAGDIHLSVGYITTEDFHVAMEYVSITPAAIIGNASLNSKTVSIQSLWETHAPIFQRGVIVEAIGNGLHRCDTDVMTYAGLSTFWGAPISPQWHSADTTDDAAIVKAFGRFTLADPSPETVIRPLPLGDVTLRVVEDLSAYA